MEWIANDKYQRVKQITDSMYQVIELISCDEELHIVTNVDIDINLYSQREIDNVIECYYETKNHFYDTTSGSNRTLLIYKMLSEQAFVVDKTFKYKSEAIAYFNELANEIDRF